MAGLWWWLVPAILLAVVALGLLVWRPMQKSKQVTELERLRKEFHREREHLEARFLTRAGASGKPRGLAWTNCDFDNDVVYARDRRSGEISAFVGVTISFEAIPGGGMEEVEAVSNLRAATAVFRVDRGRWATDGRALFNLNPSEAVRHFNDDLEFVGQEIATHS
jgi:hypothetical protein